MAKHALECNMISSLHGRSINLSLRNPTLEVTTFYTWETIGGCWGPMQWSKVHAEDNPVIPELTILTPSSFPRIQFPLFSCLG